MVRCSGMTDMQDLIQSVGITVIQLKDQQGWNNNSMAYCMAGYGNHISSAGIAFLLSLVQSGFHLFFLLHFPVIPFLKLVRRQH